MSTEKQKKLAELIIENYRNSEGKSMKQMLLEAGYSEATAMQGKKVFDNENGQMKKELMPIVNIMKRKRREALNAINKKKIGAGSGKDIVDIIDKLTKNIQLLGGKPTENIKVIDKFNYIKPNDKDNTDNQTPAKTGQGVGEAIG